MKFSLNPLTRMLVIIAILFCFMQLEARTQSISGRARTSYRSGRVELQQGLYDKALVQFLNVLEHAPNHVESMKNVADLYFMKAEEHDEEEAREFFELAHKYYNMTISTILSMDNWESYTDFDNYKSDSELKLASIFARNFREGQELYQEEDYESAIEIFEYLTNLFPERIESVQMLAAIANNQGDVDKAIGYFMSILEKDPTNTQIITNLAVEYEQMNDYETSLLYFMMLINVEPDNINGYTSAAYVNLQLQNYEEALRLYEDALVIEPDNIDLIADAANVAIEVNNNEKAISFLIQLVEHERTEDNVSYLVYQLARLQHWENLITYSKMWLEINPDAKEPVQFIIAAAHSLGDTETVREYQGRL